MEFNQIFFSQLGLIIFALIWAILGIIVCGIPLVIIFTIIENLKNEKT